MMPVFPPDAQKAVPSTLVVPRMLSALKLVVVVVVSTTPLGATRPMTRVTEVVAVPVMEATPGTESYPLTMTYCPSEERDISPPEVAVPLAVRDWLAPLSAVGSAMLWTRVPAGVYSSRNTSAEALVKAAEPVPTRYTTTLPAVKGAADAVPTSDAASRTLVASERRDRTKALMW